MSRLHVLIHYHIFKNAGTSLDYTLQQSFGDRWTTFEGTHAHDIQPVERLRAFLESRPDIVAVSSHLSRPPLPWVECRPIVFLRHPLDRAKSVYEFTVADATQPFSEIARDKSFAAYLEWALAGGRGGVVIRDYQTIHLSAASFRGESILDAQATVADLLEAKSALGGWPAVGLVDQYDRSLRLFQTVYGRLFPELVLKSLRLNATRPASMPLADKVAAIRSELGSDLSARFDAANQHDLELYQFAERRFAVLCDAAGVTASGES